MTKRNYNRFNMTGSCTECNESACASSSRSNGANAAQSTNNALLLTMDTVIAVSIFVALSALVSIIGNVRMPDGRLRQLFRSRRHRSPRRR